MASFDIEEFTLSLDEGSPFWSCQITITNVEDSLQFKPDDEFTLNVYGVLYNFYVEEISVSKGGPVNHTATIRGVGIGAKYDVPRKKPLTKTWDSDITAFDAVSELVEGDIDSWEFLNWSIPANRLAVDKGSPVQLAKSIVEVAGGVLEGQPSGLFRVRPLYPDVPREYPVLTEDLLLDEGFDVYSVSFQYANTDYIDCVRIRSSNESGISDQLEAVFPEGQLKHEGELLVYPMPWRDVDVIHTGPAGVTLEYVEDREWQIEEELVTILEGKGSTQKPIVSIDSVVWQAKDLSSLYADDYSTDIYSSHPTDKFTLAKVTYTTRAKVYRIAYEGDLTVQFLVCDEN